MPSQRKGCLKCLKPKRKADMKEADKGARNITGQQNMQEPVQTFNDD